MIKKMTQDERISDIAQKSNLSKSEVERCLNAVRDSIVDSIVRGEKASLAGIVEFTPEISKRLGVAAREEKEVNVKATTSGTVVDAVRKQVSAETYKVSIENKKGIKSACLSYIDQ